MNENEKEKRGLRAHKRTYLYYMYKNIHAYKLGTLMDLSKRSAWECI